MSAPVPPSLPLATLLAHTADAVAAVCAGRSLNDALATVPAAPRPGTQALAFRVLRGLGLARTLRRQLVPKAPPAWVDALLLSALALSHQDSESADTPPYAPYTLVSQAVEAAKQRARAQAGFVNAVLRRHLREHATQAAAAAKDPVAVWNHPRWWIETLQRDWPGQWAELLRANDRRAPMTLRVNQRQQDRASYLLRLEQAGIAAHAVTRPGATDAQAIELATPCAVSALPGFADGAVSVQDLAAQVAAPLLLGAGLVPGARVLDACAAPGGKTAHLLELAELDLLSLDADPRRLVKVSETLKRLGLRARTQAADARDVATWWDGRPYDAILLDAPCSASGIVRRHPDVRWLRRASDLDALVSTQAALLDALWPLLRPGGRLLYATCSVFKAEGVYQIDAFLQRAPDAIEQPSPGYLLPVVDNPEQVSEGPLRPSTDGFYYALLEKRSS